MYHHYYGEKIGNLTLLKFHHKDYLDHYFWFCKCSCGVEKIIRIDGKNGIKSCGCVRKEKTSTHLMSKTRFYTIWTDMKQRCSNKNYVKFHIWGGKGIKVCNKWLKFQNFKDDMYQSYLKHCATYSEKNTTLDRIDNEKDYIFSNCRWTTYLVQNNNRHFVK